MIRALILLLLAACKTSHTLEAHEDAKLAAVEHAEVKGEEHDGPWSLTTTTEEYANDDVPDRPDGGSGGLPAPDLVAVQDVRRGRLIKRTVAIEEHGPHDLAWQSSSDGWAGAETQTDLKKADTMKPDVGCALNSGLWLALAGVGVLGLVWNRRAAIWAICKRLAGIP